ACETRTISSTKPRCFFKIGTAFSLMRSASSCAFPDLHLISTMRVNIFSPPFITRPGKRPAEHTMMVKCGIRVTDHELQSRSSGSCYVRGNRLTDDRL